MQVGEACCREVVMAQATESLRSVATLMREHCVGSVVICQDRAAQRIPVGILTDRDLLMALMRPGTHQDETFAGEVMTRDPLVLHEAENIEQAIVQMQTHAVRRAPVVSKVGSLVGIVTVDDLIDVLAGQLHDIAGLIRRQLKKRN